MLQSMSENNFVIVAEKVMMLLMCQCLATTWIFIADIVAIGLIKNEFVIRLFYEIYK